MTNFMAIVPKYKFETGPTFMLSCDSDGLRWIKENILFCQQIGGAFVLGNGKPISSDDLCVLKVQVSKDREPELISCSGKSEFTWNLLAERVSHVVGQLETLIASNMPAHQYFGPGGGPYQTIVMTKNEEPTELIRAMRDGRPPHRKYP